MMNNELWKVMLQSDLREEERETCKYELRKSGSPYLEVEESEIHAGQVVGINPYVRLHTILEPLLEAVDFRETKEGKLLFHIITELVLETDRYSGYGADAVKMELLEEEILRGCFGASIVHFWRELTLQQRGVTLELLLMLYGGRKQIYCFIYEMQMLFPACVIFRERKKPDILYIYFEEEKKTHLLQKYEAVKSLFLPMDVVVHLAWSHPFLLTDIHDIECVGNRMV